MRFDSFSPTRTAAEPTVRRVLLYRLGSLGDTLIALPALHLVARAFPNAQRYMLTNHPVNVKAPPAAAILENSGLVHGYLRYSVGTRSPLELPRVWREIVRFRPQVLVYMAPGRGVASARRDAVFFRVCGVWRQIGVPTTEAMDQPQREEGFGLTQMGAPGFAMPEIPTMLEPEAARLTRNLAELGDAELESPAAWDLHLTPAERATAGGTGGCGRAADPGGPCRNEGTGEGLGTGELASVVDEVGPRVAGACPGAGGSGVRERGE